MAVLEDFPASPLKVGDDLVLVPLVVLFNLFCGLGHEEVASIDKPKEKFLGVIHVGRFLAEVVFQFVDVLHLERLVGRLTENATFMLSSHLLVDVIFLLGELVLGSRTRLTFEGGVRYE